VAVSHTAETMQDRTNRPKLLLMTNRKWHMRFRLVSESSTLNDLELLQVQIFSEFWATSRVC